MVILPLMYGGGRGIRTPVTLPPNGFQDRPVMTTSVSLHGYFEKQQLYYTTRSAYKQETYFTFLL